MGADLGFQEFPEREVVAFAWADEPWTHLNLASSRIAIALHSLQRNRSEFFVQGMELRLHSPSILVDVRTCCLVGGAEGMTEPTDNSRWLHVVDATRNDGSFIYIHDWSGMDVPVSLPAPESRTP